MASCDKYRDRYDPTNNADSYNEWCHQGDVLFMQFRQQARLRMQQQRQRHCHSPIRTQPSYRKQHNLSVVSKTKPSPKYHSRNGRRRQVPVVPMAHHHHHLPHHYRHRRNRPANDTMSTTPTTSESSTTTVTTTSGRGTVNMDKHSIGGLDDDDDAMSAAVDNDNDVDDKVGMTTTSTMNEMEAATTTTTIPKDATVKELEPVTQSPPISTSTTTTTTASSSSMSTLIVRTKRRPSIGDMDIAMQRLANAKKMKKKNNVFTARPSTNPTAKRHASIDNDKHDNDDSSQLSVFIVKATPPQYLALVEGICTTKCTTTTTSSNFNKNDNYCYYYSSPQYHYLSDMVDDGHYHQLLPHQGTATELPSIAPVAPGRWMVQILNSTSTTTTATATTKGKSSSSSSVYFRSHQSDWNGRRIRLAHIDYQRRLPAVSNNDDDDYDVIGNQKNTKTNISTTDISMVQIDPRQFRMSHRWQGDTAGDNDDDDDNHHQRHKQSAKTTTTTTNSFIGAMGITMFDGFASLSECEAWQASLANAVLLELRQLVPDIDVVVGRDTDTHQQQQQQQRRLRTTPPIIPAFTTTTIQNTYTRVDSSMSGGISGNGGVVLPVNITSTTTNHHHHHNNNDKQHHDNDYCLLLYTSEEMKNQVVAIDVVFGETSTNHHPLTERLDPQAANRSTGSSSSSTNRPTLDISEPQQQHAALTHQNLQQHTSKWSAMNVLQRFWNKKKKDEQDVQSSPLHFSDALFGVQSLAPVVVHKKEAWTLRVDEFESAISLDDHGSDHSDPIPGTVDQDGTNLVAVVPQNDLSMPSPFGTINHAAMTLATIAREPLPATMMMMNQITPTPQQKEQSQPDASTQLLETFSQSAIHSMPTNVGRVCVPHNLERKSLFPAHVTTTKPPSTRRFQAEHSNESPLLLLSSLHRAPSSLPTTKTDNEMTASRIESNHSIFCDCHQSMSSILQAADDDDNEVVLSIDVNDNEWPVIADRVDVRYSGGNDAVTNVTNVVPYQDDTFSISDVLFFEWQNADSVPEMTTTEVAMWFEQRHRDGNAALLLGPTVDSTMYFHNVLFGGLLPCDPDVENDGFTTGLWWYNWLYPVLTLVFSLYLFYCVVTTNRYLSDLLHDTTANFMNSHTDPSQGLLSLLKFVETESGYTGTVCIE